MNFKNDVEFLDNLDRWQKILYMIFKIIFILIFAIFVYQIINQVNLTFEKNKVIIENNNINNTNTNNIIPNEPNNNEILKINSIDNSNKTIAYKNNSIVDIYNKKIFQSFLYYENVFFNSFDIFRNMRKLFFTITYINYTFSEEFNMVKLEYIVGLYDQNKTLLYPSDLSLYNNLHFACFIETEKKKTVNSLPYIYSGKYLKCTEIFYYKENIKFGIIATRNKSFFKIFFSSKDVINYENTSHLNDDAFDHDLIKKNFMQTVEDIKSKKFDEPSSLKKAYFRKPIFDLRRNLIRNNSNWLFRNFYNDYYCYCVGNFCFKNEGVSQICKFLYYIVLIDKERYLYPKTDYIFVDFIFKTLTADDTYPVFQEMKKQNYPVHYITEKDDIREKYCQNNTKCDTIIPININSYFTYGDFFENYLPLVLKTKAFVSCKEKHFHRVGYLFYRIEYVTYIAVGHGVCYFKDYLFDNNRIYGSKRNNKIVIPPNQELVNIAVNHGWKEENIIKLNLPRWDKYNTPLNSGGITDIYSGNITSNSILIMFTWRMSIKYYYDNISTYYLSNLINLLQNEKLINELKANNITLYLSFHRYIKEKYLNYLKGVFDLDENVKVLEQDDLAECLAKTSLVVSDFSSVIFDLMYRGKPYVIYVPDSDDPNIDKIYSKDYVDLINRMKNGTFNIANKCDTIEKTVDKIVFYIKNKFAIDDDLKKNFEFFDFKVGNNIDTFIKYLLALE